MGNKMKTVLFLLCLLAPLALAQHDILNLIEKTPEGKEILNHLFVQTKLMGNDLDVSALQEFLKANEDRIAAERKAFGERAQRVEVQCHRDEAAGGALIREQLERSSNIGAQVASAQRTLTNTQNSVKRCTQELENTQELYSTGSTVVKAWNEYFAAASANRARQEEAIDRIQNAMANNDGRLAFVQLPQEYHTSLAQIKTSMESNEVDFEEMNPIVQSLLEVMTSENAVKPAARVAIVNLIHSLRRSFEQRWNLVEQQNEVNTALFAGIKQGMEKNTQRTEREIAAFNKYAETVQSRVTGLKAAAQSVQSLVEQITNIAKLRTEECGRLTNFNKDQSIRNQKMLAIMQQIQELLLTRRQATTSFFLQKQMSLN